MTREQKALALGLTVAQLGGSTESDQLAVRWVIATARVRRRTERDRVAERAQRLARLEALDASGRAAAVVLTMSPDLEGTFEALRTRSWRSIAVNDACEAYR